MAEDANKQIQALTAQNTSLKELNAGLQEKLDASVELADSLKEENDSLTEKLKEVNPKTKPPAAKPKLSVKEKFSGIKGGKKVKVEFVDSPTGLLNLAYNVGEVAEFGKNQADFLVDLKLGKIVS